MTDDIEALLKAALKKPQVGLSPDGICIPVNGALYRLNPLLRRIRANASDAVTDDAWHLLRAVEDHLPLALQRQAVARSYVAVRDDIERLEEMTTLLRLRITARTTIESAWSDGSLPLERDLCLVGEEQGIVYGYWPGIDAINGKAAIALYSTMAQALTAHRDDATYQVTAMPRIAWRTVLDVQEVLAEKLRVLDEIAQRQGAYPYILPKRFLN
jgi:hypothetical protein